MKHYFDVASIKGEAVEPVDVITFGSPCQDLSIAGKRAGLKHSDLDDDSTTRSGLFMEAVRIIKEMRRHDEASGRTGELIRPRFAVWENVPGAFSSNRGQDFRVVLEELARIKEPKVSIPLPGGGKWNANGTIFGDDWSIAWRVLDAQYWGVPQRRRRIFLVADFAGQCAGEILFKPESLHWHPSQSREAREGTTRNVTERIGGTSAYMLKVRCGSDTYKSDGSVGTAGKGPLISEDISGTLSVSTLFQPIIADMTHANDVLRISENGVVPTLQHRMGTGGNQVPLVGEPLL